MKTKKKKDDDDKKTMKTTTEINKKHTDNKENAVKGTK